MSAQIREGLEWLGHKVMSTQQYRKRGDFQGTTTTVGLPDLYVLPKGRKNGRWVALEVKRPGSYGRLTREQAELVAAGKVHVVRSLEDAIRALDAGEGGEG